MASGFLFALLLCLSIGLSAACCCEETKSSCPGPCPPGWTQFGSRCFSFNIQGRSWTDAESFCMSAGGNLASVHSDEEYFFLREFIYKVTSANRESWIGGFDAVKEGVWQWSDGSKFDYKQWAPREPNNLGGVEHCLEMNYQDKLNDRPCQTVYPFVCSKNL